MAVSKETLQEKLEKFKFTNRDIWLCLIHRRRKISSEEIRLIFEKYAEKREANISELCRMALKEEIDDIFLNQVCFNYELKKASNPKIDISPALDDLSILCSTMAVQHSVDTEEKVENFQKTTFGEKCAKAVIQVFKEEIRPYLKKDRCIIVTKRRAFPPELLEKK
jgi:hypothetical protein